jgi:hypothetical protein
MTQDRCSALVVLSIETQITTSLGFEKIINDSYTIKSSKKSFKMFSLFILFFVFHELLCNKLNIKHTHNIVILILIII